VGGALASADLLSDVTVGEGGGGGGGRLGSLKVVRESGDGLGMRVSNDRVGGLGL
jgi:hypothetical protein